MNAIRKDWEDVPITSVKQIVSTRNYIIHGYDSLDDEILWSIVIKHLSVLKLEVKELLES